MHLFVWGYTLARVETFKQSMVRPMVNSQAGIIIIILAQRPTQAAIAVLRFVSSGKKYCIWLIQTSGLSIFMVYGRYSWASVRVAIDLYLDVDWTTKDQLKN